MRWLTLAAMIGATALVGCGDERCLPVGPSAPIQVDAVQVGGAGPSVGSTDSVIPPPDHPPIDTIPQMPLPRVDPSTGAAAPSGGPGRAVSSGGSSPPLKSHAQPGCGVPARR